MFKKIAVVADRLSRIIVARPVLRYQDWRCKRARAYLLTHDQSFREMIISKRVVRERERLYSEGVSPMDPRIPDRWTVDSELPPMAWPHRDEPL